MSEARIRLADVIEESRRSGEPVSVTRRGRRVAVIIDAETFDRLVDAADDLEDRRELAAAREDDDYVWVDRAFGASRTDLTTFVTENLVMAANRVLADRHVFVLDEDARVAWEAVNARPARVVAGLRELMERPSPFQMDE